MKHPHLSARLQTAIGAFIGVMQRGAAAIVMLAVIVTYVCLDFAAGHLSVNNDTIDMLDESLPFRMEYERLRAAFPALEDTMMLVVEAPTPEQATAAADRLSARLHAMPDTVASVFWPAGEAFFRDNGLLFRSADELAGMSDRLSEAQPLLARLAESTTVPTFFELLAEAERRRD